MIYNMPYHDTRHTLIQHYSLLQHCRLHQTEHTTQTCSYLPRSTCLLLLILCYQQIWLSTIDCLGFTKHPICQLCKSIETVHIQILYQKWPGRARHKNDREKLRIGRKKKEDHYLNLLSKRTD